MCGKFIRDRKKDEALPVDSVKIRFGFKIEKNELIWDAGVTPHYVENYIDDYKPAVRFHDYLGDLSFVDPIG
jgi:hypothetical protein